MEMIGEIDLTKYAGEWIEMARKPNFFQRQCSQSKAFYYDIEYKDGKAYKLKVKNSCTKENGQMSSVEGKAKIITPDHRNLSVSFSFFTDWGSKVNYQVLYIDSLYTQAIVGSPNKKYLWILSRDFLSSDEVENLLAKAREFGYNTEDMIFSQEEKWSE